MEAAHFSSTFYVLSESCKHICKCEATSSNRTSLWNCYLPIVTRPRSHPRNFGSYLEGSDHHFVNIYICTPSAHEFRPLKRIWLCLVPRIAVWQSCRAGRSDPSSLYSRSQSRGRRVPVSSAAECCNTLRACVFCAKRNLALHLGGFCLCGPQVRMSRGTKSGAWRRDQ
jgi:hypothetical protein